MEIIEDRHGRAATIISSQLPVESWFDVIGEEIMQMQFLIELYILRTG